MEPLDFEHSLDESEEGSGKYLMNLALIPNFLFVSIVM